MTEATFERLRASQAPVGARRSRRNAFAYPQINSLEGLFLISLTGLLASGVREEAHLLTRNSIACEFCFA